MKLRVHKTQKYDMRHIIHQVHSIIRHRLPRLPRYAVLGAWFFAIVSAIPLIWLMIEGQGSDSHSRVFGASVNGVMHTVWGLTYSGFFGSILLWLEFFALIAAIAFTALPGNFKFAPREFMMRMRRVGHSYLTGWAGLWMLGTMYLAAVDPGFWIIQAMFITALFACTVYRAVREWNGNPSMRNGETGNAETGNGEVAHHQAAPERSADPGPSPLTDMADISRFMLHRSAVRPSARVRECEVRGHSHSSRLFTDAKPHTALDDDYGAQLRATLLRGVGLAKTAASWVKTTARQAAARVLPNHPRQPVEIDVAPAENHTDTLRFRRV